MKFKRFFLTFIIVLLCFFSVCIKVNADEKYSITFVDDDGETILKEATEYDYGTLADDIVKPENPTKKATTEYTYTFAGWSPEITDVTDNAIYTAVYNKTKNKYRITWKDQNGEILEIDYNVEYGTMPEYNGEIPNDGYFCYDVEFDYWKAQNSDSEGVSVVVGDTIYVMHKKMVWKQFKVSFVDEDGTLLKEGYCRCDTSVEQVEKPDDPVKEDTDKYSYVFAGWYSLNDDRFNIREDTIFKPLFRRTLKDSSSKDVYWNQEIGGISSLFSFLNNRGISKNSYHDIQFNDISRSGIVYEDLDNMKDISKDGDLSVIAGVKNDVLYIQFDGTLHLNQDSSELFNNTIGVTIYHIYGLEYVDTYDVLYMGNMFYGQNSLEYVDLSSFDTSNVIDMHNMFNGCSSLTTLNVSSFNTSKVINMSYMFNGCRSLETLNLSNFDTSEVTNMSYMFIGCSSLTTLNVSNFNTSKVTNMEYMFCECSSLTSLNLSSFDTSKVTSMADMFRGCSSLTTLNVSNFITSEVTNMGGMFANDTNITQLNLSNFNTSKVTNMGGMFANDTNLTQLNLSNFNTSKVTNMSGMFSDCSSLTSLNLSSFDTSKVTSMAYMFMRCSSLTSLNLSSFDTSEVTTMEDLFDGDSSLTTLNVSSFNTSKVINMAHMFRGCSSLTTLNLSNFVTSEVTNMYDMFSGCSSLLTLNVSTFNTSKVTIMDGMFNGCSSLTTLDLSNFDASKSSINYFIQGTSNLKVFKTPNKFNNVIKLNYFFVDEDNNSYINVDNTLENTTLKKAITIIYYGVDNYGYNYEEHTSYIPYDSDTLGELYVPNIKENHDFIGWYYYTYTELYGTQKVTDNYSMDEYREKNSIEGEINRISLFGRWELKKYTVTFKDYDGTILDIQENVEYNTSAYSPETPERVGYTFKGWDKSFTNVTSDLEVTAVYEINKYTVTFKDYDGSVLKTQENIEYNTSATAPDDPKRTGYTFKGWNKSFTNITENTDIIAEYDINKYTITFDSNGGSAVENQEIDYNSKVNVPESPVLDKYTFVGWYANPDLSIKYDFNTLVTSNLTLYAKWEKTKGKLIKVTFDPNGGSTKTTSKNVYQLLEYGDLPVPTRKGYTFTGWYLFTLGGIKIESTTEVPAIKNHTLYAHWSKTKYTIIYNLNGGKNNTKNPSTYYVTTSNITLQKPTKKGYTFGGWYKDAKFKTKVTEIKKGSTGNKTLYAKWTAITYTVAFDKNGATSGTMKSQSMKYDKEYTLTKNAYKRKGYTFTGWNTKKDGKGTAYTNLAKVKNLKSSKSTLTLYAQWKKNTYTIKYELNEGTNSTKNPGTYSVTSAITFKNPTKKGYTFKGWYSDSKFKTKVTSIVKGTTGNKTLYAKWSKTKYTITYNLNGGKNSSSNKTSYTITDKVTLYDATKSGYILYAWYLDAKFTKPIYGIPKGSTGNKTLYAKWVKSTTKTKAIKSARTYLNSYPYSYNGLVEHLESVGYSHEDAVYGVDNCGANWKEQALIRAEYYKKNLEFSYYDIAGRLEDNDGFTHEEAIYAVDNCGINWKNRALESAKYMLEQLPYSYNSALSEMLHGYTREQAEYALENCGVDWKEMASKSAKSLLKDNPYSYLNLVERLENAGYTHEEAVYGANNCEANWNEQALRCAQLNCEGYTYNDVVSYLESENFTHEEAVYAAEQMNLQ